MSLRLRDEQFVKDLHAFAKRNKTTVTALAEDFFTQLLENERGIIKLEQG